MVTATPHEDVEAAYGGNTTCWRCSKSYAFDTSECPHCHAINANYSLESALFEQAQQAKVADIIESVTSYGQCAADELPESMQNWLADIRERLETLQQHAYAEGRKDESEAAEWQHIETAPEDEHILIATTGGHVGTAYWTDEGDGKVWGWGHPEKDGGQYVHPNLTPLAWMPLPKHPEAA